MKLNRTEIGVLARRLADEITEINKARIEQEVKLADLKNAKLGMSILKKFHQMSPEMKQVINYHGRLAVNKLTHQDVLTALRPNFGSTYARAGDIEDQLIIDQIACPDVTQLLQRVKEHFLAKSKPATP